MTAIANTFQTYQSKGNREQLANIISNISPRETPFMTMAGRGSVDGVFFEWQQDSLATPVTTNQKIEGFDVTSFAAVVPTVRVGNYVQISSKDVVISGTQERIEKAGRKSELAYQVSKLGAELKRDMETDLLWNKGASAGSASTARITGSLPAWVKTNVNKETTGVNPVYTTVPTDVRTDSTTPRTFTETILKDVIKQCWDSGATPTYVMVGSYNKQIASTFPGVATKTIDQGAGPKKAVVVGAADIYVSDFGTLTIIPNRFQRARDAWVIDPEHVEVAFLRPYMIEKLAKTGDAEKRLLLAEYGLKVKNEKGLGLAADLTTSA